MNNTVIKKQLESLGFTKNAAAVYVTLMQKGQLKAGEIISFTALQRSVVYNCLKELSHRKLISESVRKGVRIFSPLDPQMLTFEFTKKLKEAEEVATSLQSERVVMNHEAYIYEGDDIVKLAAERSLNAPSGSTVYFLGSSKFGIQANLEKFWKKYHKNRELKGIRCKILYDKFAPKEIVRERNSYALCEAKYLPIEIEIPMSFNIWNDHVAMLLPGDHPPTTFVIRSQSTADALVEYFNYLWKHSPKN